MKPTLTNAKRWLNANVSYHVSVMQFRNGRLVWSGSDWYTLVKRDGKFRLNDQRYSLPLGFSGTELFTTASTPVEIVDIAEGQLSYKYIEHEGTEVTFILTRMGSK